VHAAVFSFSLTHLLYTMIESLHYPWSTLEKEFGSY